MSDILKHRGPDDVGFFFDHKVALGNTRLSIIDIKSGHQPVHNENSTIWITYNGEIHNFQQLRRVLEKLGHEFYTNSDTEVIVHAYEEWGENSVKKFNGMWAFALWDSNKKQLFLSRDRLGIKPLYYFLNGKRFIFASEIKALLQDESIPKMPNDKIIFEYLVQCRLDHTEQTFFNQIKRLLPAHNLLLDESRVQVKKYWEIRCTNKETKDSHVKDDEYTGKFLGLFKDSCRLRQISDVPIGTCLSGGLDSSAIVCMINQLLMFNGKKSQTIGERQKTFTACFKDKRIDEREYAEEIIAQTGAEGDFVLPSSSELWRDIKKLVYYQEEPFIGTSVFAQWCVMKLASRKVKVLLDGQGGDELLAGYTSDYLVFLQDLLKGRKIGNFVKELLLSLDIVAPYIRQIKYFSSSYSKQLNEIKELLNYEFISEFDHDTEINAVYEDLPDLLRREMTTTSLPVLLRYEDKNSMAFSLEVRLPFLDHRLIEYIFSLPVTQRLKNGWTKHILRNAMKGILPEKIRRRREKIAFETPEATWMKELGREIKEIFASSEFGGRKYFRQREILKKFDEFCAGKLRYYPEFFWRILNLEIWFRVFFERT